MKRHGNLMTITILILAFILNGCSFSFGGDHYNETLENHKAISLWHEGVWEERYESTTEKYISGPADIIVVLSIDVKKELAEADVQEIMEYYEYKTNAAFDDKGVYIGERSEDYTCYAAFYKEGTDDLIRRYKYKNGEFATPGEEDEGHFPRPEDHNSLEGPQSEPGELP